MLDHFHLVVLTMCIFGKVTSIFFENMYIYISVPGTFLKNAEGIMYFEKLCILIMYKETVQTRVK